MGLGKISMLSIMELLLESLGKNYAPNSVHTPLILWCPPLRDLLHCSKIYHALDMKKNCLQRNFGMKTKINSDVS
jgi:hypothetical protein